MSSVSNFVTVEITQSAEFAYVYKLSRLVLILRAFSYIRAGTHTYTTNSLSGGRVSDQFGDSIR